MAKFGSSEFEGDIDLDGNSMKNVSTLNSRQGFIGGREITVYKLDDGTIVADGPEKEIARDSDVGNVVNSVLSSEGANTSIKISAGEYIQRNGIFVTYDNVHIYGEGWNTHLVRHTDLPVDDVMIGIGPDGTGGYEIVDDCSVHHLRVTGLNEANDGNILIHAPEPSDPSDITQYCKNDHVYNVFSEQTGDECIVIDWGAFCSIRNCHAIGKVANNSQGVGVFRSIYSFLVGNYVEDCGSGGILFSESKNCMAIRNISYNNPNPFKILSSSTYPLKNNVIAQNISYKDSHGITIGIGANNTIENNLVIDSEGNGIEADNVTGTRIKNNVVVNPSGRGILANPTEKLNDLFILDNYIIGAGNQGIRVNGGTSQYIEDPVIKNNRVYESANNSIAVAGCIHPIIKNNIVAKGENHGIQLKENPCSNVIIEENTIKDPTATGCVALYISTGTDNPKVKDNVVRSNTGNNWMWGIQFPDANYARIDDNHISDVDTVINNNGTKPIMNGVSQGTYTGDGTTGRTIVLGFNPKEVVIKDGAGNIYDVREGLGTGIIGSSPSGELSLTSNGFTIGDNGADADPNTDTESYTYYAR